MTKRATDEKALKLVERRLGVESENTGGGILCFVFYGSRNGKKADLLFGYGNGGLGFDLHDDGQILDSGELAEGSDADAQADFIMEVCARLGYKIENVPPAILRAEGK